MHTAAKITLGLGGVITLLGVIFTVSGGYAIDNLEDIDIEDVSVWNGEEGTYNFDNKYMLIYVRDNVRCDSFTFSMTDDSGEYPYENDECTKDGSKPAEYLDDPEGWYHVGSVNTTGEYVIEASSEVYLVTGSAIFGEILTEAGGSVLTMHSGQNGGMFFVIFVVDLVIYDLIFFSPFFVNRISLFGGDDISGIVLSMK